MTGRGDVPRAGWRIEHRTGTAAELHTGWPGGSAAADRRMVALCRPTDRAVVLGSTQPDETVDHVRCRGHGVGVVRRRSGGGAVLVGPDEPVWVDVWVPAGDPLWHADVATAFDWVGRWWSEALAAVGVTDVGVPGPGERRCTRWSALVCFGGVAAGEVATTDGRKVVGMAQRRTRHGAWFHTAAYGRWRPEELVTLLALEPTDRAAAAADLLPAAVGVADLVGEGAVRALPDVLLATLP